MGINFAHLFWVGLVCGAALLGTAAGVVYSCGDIQVQVGTVVMEDGGVQP